MATIVANNRSLSKIKRLAILAAIVPILVKYHRTIYVILKTLPRDAKLVYRYVVALLEIKRHARSNATVIKLFRERARVHPNKPCFLFDGRIWTNSDIELYANRVARVFQKLGCEKGDTVALMMQNRPEYAAIWLGLGKIGAITALIDTDLRLQSLVHCIRAAGAKCIVYADEYSSAIDDIGEYLKGVRRLKHGPCHPDDSRAIERLDELLRNANSCEPIVCEEPGYNDQLLYVYTSGTTGVPKAAIIPHSRFLFAASCAYHMIGLRCSDVLYNPLPMHHVSGGVIGTGSALVKGIPNVLRERFSVSAYWTDCIKYNCTMALYIGEMCRYLLSAPVRPEDTAHSVRTMLGSGLRPQIWREFVQRFKVERINEIFGSSEGNANIVNIDNRIGAVGFLPSFLPRSALPVAIVRVDPETEQPARGPDGFCVRAETNEPGMLIGMIKTGNACQEFAGYVDREASAKKTISNAFRKGDKAFLTGDILVQDERGYVYFKDRTGDTFSWKGKEVATAELENVIADIADNRDVIVYGVQVPRAEGKAVMAVIADPENDLDLRMLAEDLDDVLPSHARPIFLRVAKKLQLTPTCKLKKNHYREEGFDPNNFADKLYFRSGSGEYREVTPVLYQNIISGYEKL